MFLLDSNIIIYAIQPQYQKVRDWISDKELTASEITRLEVLGYHRLSNEDRQDFGDLFSLTSLLPISEPIIDNAIKLRLQRKMSLGDSLIAATALCHSIPLATRNINDFSWIESLVLVNPVD